MCRKKTTWTNICAIANATSAIKLVVCDKLVFVHIRNEAAVKMTAMKNPVI